MKAAPRELKDYKVIKTFHIFNAKTIEEISRNYAMFIFSESETEITAGMKLSDSIRIHICEKPWEDEQLVITKKVA
jgi:hypothetical protein